MQSAFFCNPPAAFWISVAFPIYGSNIVSGGLVAWFQDADEATLVAILRDAVGKNLRSAQLRVAKTKFVSLHSVFAEALFRPQRDYKTGLNEGPAQMILGMWRRSITNASSLGKDGKVIPFRPHNDELRHGSLGAWHFCCFEIE